MKNLRDEMLSFHRKTSESGVDPTLPKQNQCLELLLNPTLRLGLLIRLHPVTTRITTRMSSRWTWSLMGLHFLPSLLNLSLSMFQNTRILNPTTRNVVPIRSTIRYLQNTRSIQIRGNTSQNPATFLSRRQRKMSPLPMANTYKTSAQGCSRSSTSGQH